MWDMKLVVYKGFNKEFLESLAEEPLLDISISKRQNVLKYTKDFNRKLRRALSQFDDEEVAWITYEEYTFIKEAIDAEVKYGDINLVIIRNNLYPDSYPVEFEISPELAEEVRKVLNGQDKNESSAECNAFLGIYNSLTLVDGVYYASYYNYEYEDDSSIKFVDYFPSTIGELTGFGSGDYYLFINGDIDSYLKDFAKIVKLSPKTIAVKSTNCEVAKGILSSLKAYCSFKGIALINFEEDLASKLALENELKVIVRDDLKIPNFKDFRNIKFYKNPDIDKETIDISQAQIIEDIITQAENAYDDNKGNNFRDIFITASTGAGKSVMFQVPAVYLAKKHKKLTIIIEPVKALMEDQKVNLNNNGYFKVETFNSDLISQAEKESVLKRVKNGEVDLLYLSPETLLSYSLETIVGDREIGLLIVDEAHIVTTWGVGFRPDYWYLGSYINMIRNQIQTSQGKKRKVYHFPICAFTATAINGGLEDSVSETIISLYMENPIKYIGYVRREDIAFDIKKIDTPKKLGKSEHEDKKIELVTGRLKQWIPEKEKTIVYCPYASTADTLYKRLGINREVGIYTGRNIDDINTEYFNNRKKQTFAEFRDGKKSVLFATKAFGMGIDVDDISNVYHYAVTGNLCDYVQEIGRAARKPGIQGKAITDILPNDFSFMRTLFGMSQIKQYQVRMVLEGVYNTYKSKKCARNFLLSPEAFTYIFNNDEQQGINKLKTCLMMLEKDFYDKYKFKVLIARPQGVFTKAFICIAFENEETVLNSKYGKYIKRIDDGRYKERQADGSQLSDVGDIYTIDLKGIWEDNYPDISFPQFKYFYFSADERVMPEIRKMIYPRQNVNIKSCHEEKLADIRNTLLLDFEYIANVLYTKFKKTFFTKEDFSNAIQERFKPEQARVIANSLFDLVDPKGFCAKGRIDEKTGKTKYSMGNGNFKELMRKAIVKSKIMGYIMRDLEAQEFKGYMSLDSDEYSNTALKLMSIFGYITYEIVGGKEPEIFIRLNDPYKIKDLVMKGDYSNSYVKRAREKHDRDVKVLTKFFYEPTNDKERWDFIEDYFLGYDVIGVAE